MRTLLTTLGIAALLVCSQSAGACGDKLLVLGRPLRFSSSRPAAILAYAPPGSPLESVFKRPEWISAMAKGKHQLRVAQSPEQVAEALRTERFDVVLAGWPEARNLPAQVAAAAPATVFVPFVNGNARDVARAAEKAYGVAVKDGAKSGDYLLAIGRAVDLHDRRVEAAAREKRNSGKSS
ncbi:MAG TPA: hypothetical protein VEI01_12830 [Terriglobales bacterium]|nr:hypothetical protein [Terriglobales bacterium]